MADQTTTALQGIAKTLRLVVAPAVSDEQPLAQQELRMVIRYLEFLRARVDHSYARARLELAIHHDLACDVLGLVHGSDEVSVDGLREATAEAQALLGATAPPIADLRTGTLAVAATLSQLVRDIRHLPVAGAVERAVVRGAEPLTRFERSWYLALGLDHFGDELRPVEELLAGAMPPS